VGKGTRIHVDVAWFVVKYRRQYPCENNMFAICKHLGDNCIVFEKFTASIGDLMVTN